MKKLNQSGFGMSTLLVIIVILILFVIIFSIIAANNGLEKGLKTSYSDFMSIKE